jgi:S-adenosylmethionine hydrolase
MKMSGVITITTDFGHQGPFVGVMKGVMLSRLPDARIVDLTHEIVVHWPAEAGFWLVRSFGYFPAGTVHVAVVDPGVGTSREIVAVTAKGHVFLAPDNGLLAPISTVGTESATNALTR